MAKCSMRYPCWSILIVLLIITEFIFADTDADEEEDDETEYDCNDQCDPDEVFIPIKLKGRECNKIFEKHQILDLSMEEMCNEEEIEFTLKDEDGEYKDVSFIKRVEYLIYPH